MILVYFQKFPYSNYITKLYSSTAKIAVGIKKPIAKQLIKITLNILVIDEIILLP
jgi:hypothetical protein